jgi:gamma-glutamyltranspeptidase/glutathione hydrolase
MKQHRLLVAVALVLSACTPPVRTGTNAPDVPPRVAAQFPAGWRYAAQSTFAGHAMVASNSPLASAAGIEILRQGGNAVDAAVAVGFAMVVTYPEAGNIGGGGYMVIRLADGRTAAIDYREMAPAAAYREMYLDSTGKLTKASIVGRAASGVPGAVAGLTAALAKYGTMSLERVMAPAIRLASEGFEVDSVLSSSIAGKDTLIRQFGGAELFLPNGRAPAPGSRFVQNDLAETLRLIARNGAAGFYRGSVAEKIAAEMSRDCPAGVPPKQRASHACGFMTIQDLASYEPVWREPLHTTYRGYSFFTMPPSSSGGITVGETLNILESFDKLPPFGSAEYVNLVASAFQRAFVDRNSKLGDPAFVSVPTDVLISKPYARRLAGTISRERHTPTTELPANLAEGTETTHYSVVDAMGNAVATTTTLNSLYGSGVFIRGAGFFMNNEMDDFTSEPGKPNQFGLVQGESNSIQPRKRMLSAMSPSIVLDPRGNILLVVGGRGGPRIITAVTQVILNVIDNRMSLADAVNAPRIHHQALPDTLRYESGGLDGATLDRLRAMGYALQPLGKIEGSTVSIMRVNGGWVGMSDPRSNGGALGY